MKRWYVDLSCLDIQAETEDEARIKGEAMIAEGGNVDICSIQENTDEEE